MRSMCRSWRLAGLAAVTLLLSVGCLWGLTSALAASSSPRPSPSINGKVVLRLGWLADADNLNPFIGTNSSAFTIWYMNYDSLVGLSPVDLSPEKTTGLATDWKSTPDGKTWTFTLRRTAKWQDNGQPVTARDVAFTFNFIIQNNATNWTSYTANIKKVTAVDDYTVRFDCSAPTPALLNSLGEMPILPEHIWSKMSPSVALKTFPNSPKIIGSGPFQCVDVKKSNYLVMQANKSYWRGAPHVDSIVFEMFTNADTMGQEMKAGGIDGCLGLLQAQMTMLAHDSGIVAKPIQVNGYDELGFNCYQGMSDGKPWQSLGNPVLRDWKFRQALQWAVDKNKLCQIAYGGMAKPADTVITADYYHNPDWHWTPPADQAYTFNLAKAGQMLTAAGYPLKNGVRLDKTGKPIGTLRLWARSSYPQSITCGKFMTGWFQSLGLKINFSTVDDGALESALTNTVNGKFTPDYDMFEWGWYNDIDPGPGLSYFTTSQIDAWSDCAWSDPQYDALYKQQSTEMNQQKRLQMVYQLQQMIYEQTPYIPLAFSDDTEAWNTSRWTDWVQVPAKVGNVVFPPYGYETYFSVRPKAGGGGSSSGTKGVLILGIVVGVLVVGAVVYVLIKRRRGTVTESVEE